MRSETATTTGFALRTETLTPLHWLGVVLASITGAIHLWLGVSFAPDPLGVSFLLAGLGFFGAIALLLLDVRRRQLYLVGIAYTGVQVVAWYAVNGLKLEPVDVTDKIVQLALIAVLFVLYRRESR